MVCNQETFELRVEVFTKGARLAIGVRFFDVSLDLRSFGLKSKPKGNESCFESVFYLLFQLKTVAFGCSQYDVNKGPFGRMQTARQNNEVLPAARLYVQSRQASDSRASTAIGVFFEQVTITSAVGGHGHYLVSFTADSAKKENF